MAYQVLIIDDEEIVDALLEAKTIEDLKAIAEKYEA